MDVAKYIQLLGAVFGFLGPVIVPFILYLIRRADHQEAQIESLRAELKDSETSARLKEAELREKEIRMRGKVDKIILYVKSYVRSVKSIMKTSYETEVPITKDQLTIIAEMEDIESLLGDD